MVETLTGRARVIESRQRVRLPTLMAWGLPALLSLLLLPRVLLFVRAGISRLSWLWQLDFVEGVNLNATLQLAQGHNIYRHNGPESFLSAPYPPLFYLITAPISWVTGTSLVPGRLVSLLATIVIALLVAHVVWKATKLPAAGVLAGAMWLSLSPVIAWSAFSKQDTLALALELSGLAWALSRLSGRKLYIAALFFFLAVCTKQSTWAAAAATTLWLSSYRLRTGIRLAALLVGPVVVTFVTANLLLEGGLAEHLLGNHNVPYRLEGAGKRLLFMAGETWPLLAIGGATLLGLLVAFVVRLRRGRYTLQELRSCLRSPFGLIVFYTFFGWGSTLVTLGTEGANYNHLLYGLLPTCMLLGIGVGYPLQCLVRNEQGRVGQPAVVSRTSGLVAQVSAKLPGRDRALIMASSLLATSLLVLQLFTFRDPGWSHPAGSAGVYGEDMQKVSDLIASTPGDVYSSEDNYLILSNGRLVLYDDHSTFGPLAKAGLWDDSVFVQHLRDRDFALVLIKHGIRPGNRWTAEQFSAFEDNYNRVLLGHIDAFAPRRYGLTPAYKQACTLALGENGDSVALEGFSYGPGVLGQGSKRGELLFVALYWQPKRAITGDYATFVQLINENGERVAAQDNPHTAASGPTNTWKTDQLTIDGAAVPLPADLRRGRYKVIAGMYKPVGGSIKALSATCKKGATLGDAILLGDVQVK